MPIDDAAAQQALDRLIFFLPGGTGQVVAEQQKAVQRAARANLADPLGPLAESIINEGPDMIGAFSYRGRTGPTLDYGRQRELGGPIDPLVASVLTAADRAPGYWMWDYGDGRGLRDVFTHHVYQYGQHYLKRGVYELLPELLRIADRVWGRTIKSAF